MIIVPAICFPNRLHLTGALPVYGKGGIALTPGIVKTLPIYITKHVVLEKPVPVPEPVIIEKPYHVPVEKVIPIPIEKIIHKPVPIPVPVPQVTTFVFTFVSARNRLSTPTTDASSGEFAIDSFLKFKNGRR